MVRSTNFRYLTPLSTHRHRDSVLPPQRTPLRAKISDVLSAPYSPGWAEKEGLYASGESGALGIEH